MASPSSSSPRAPEPRPDELDPELVSLKKAPARVGPVLALSVIALCGYVGWTTRHDLRFAMRSATPIDADRPGPGEKLVLPEPESYVTMRAMPDLRHVAWLRGTQATGHRLLPAVGTSKRAWLQLTDDIYSAAPVYDLRFTGRLRALSDTPFAEALTAHVRSLPAELTVLRLDSLASPDGLMDVGGDRVTLAPDDAVTLDERVPGAALVTLYQNDHVKDEAAARAALAAANLPAVAMSRSTERSWTFEVAAPTGLEAIRQTIAQADLYAAMSVDAVADKIIRHEGHWRDVQVSAASLRLASGETVPLDRVVRLSAMVRPILPEGVMLLVVGEVPGDYWYLFVLDGILVLVTLAMIWAGLRGLRDHRPPEVPLSFASPTVPSDDA